MNQTGKTMRLYVKAVQDQYEFEPLLTSNVRLE